MNFEKVRRKNRKAISPVLATVILIAITLIAAIAIAGFVFGLFGSFTSSPQLTASPAQCGAAGAAPGDAPVGPAVVGSAAVACEFNLSNTGSGNAGIPGGACSISVAGITEAGTVYLSPLGVTSGAPLTSLAGNTSPKEAVCQATIAIVAGNAPASGSTAGGTITTSSATVPFSGTWD
jgi:flagellin-like protein